MLTGPAAADDSVTGNVAVCPSPRLTFWGRLIVPGFNTVTLVVAFAIPGADGVAVMVAGPGPAPVKATLAVVPFAAKVTLAGTVTTFVLLELRLTKRPPAGAGDERLSATFCVMIPLMVTVGEAKLMVAVTCTAELAAV